MGLIEINRNPSPRELRQFAGIWWPLFCALVGGLVWHKLGEQNIAIGIWSAGGVLAVLGLAVPAAIKPVFVGLLYVTFPIGWLVSHLLLALTFYLVITPIGLLMRLLGRDPMTRRLDRQAKSYWTPREKPPNVERYFKQY